MDAPGCICIYQECKHAYTTHRRCQHNSKPLPSGTCSESQIVCLRSLPTKTRYVDGSKQWPSHISKHSDPEMNGKTILHQKEPGVSLRKSLKKTCIHTCYPFQHIHTCVSLIAADQLEKRYHPGISKRVCIRRHA